MPKRIRENYKKSDPKWNRGQAKRTPQGAGRQREGATAGEKPKVGTNPQRATRNTLETREMPRSLGETQEPQETKKVKTKKAEQIAKEKIYDF